jgi:hypothetical protein
MPPFFKGDTFIPSDDLVVVESSETAKRSLSTVVVGFEKRFDAGAANYCPG